MGGKLFSRRKSEAEKLKALEQTLNAQEGLPADSLDASQAQESFPAEPDEDQTDLSFDLTELPDASDFCPHEQDWDEGEEAQECTFQEEEPDTDDVIEDPGEYSLGRKLWGKLTRRTCVPGLTYQECEGMDIDRLTARLRQAGFYKIQCYPRQDLSYRRKKLLNTASGITIGGVGDFRRNTAFPFDAQIEIVYHLFKNVTVGFWPQQLKDTNAAETKAYFKRQGFGIVRTVPIRDLKMGWIKLDGQVEQVLVDGFDHFRPDSEFPVDCEVTIYYHTYKSSH